MPNIIKNVQNVILRLLLWRSFLYVVATAIMTTVTALSGLDWAQASSQTRLMVTLGVIGTCFLNYQAFIDQTIARLAKGELPGVDLPNELPAPGTVKKTSTVQVETTTTPSTP